MGTTEWILSAMGIDTQIVDFNLSSDEKIESVSVKDISNLIPNDLLASNVIIYAFLNCFGVNLQKLTSNIIPQPNILKIGLLQNLLLNAKWEDTEVLRGGTTYTAMEYMKTFFSIYDKEEFVNSLYMNVTDNIIHSDAYSDDYMILSIEDETYQMIKFLAFCIGNNQSFISTQIGEQTGINIPFDPSNIRNLEETIYDVLVEKGLLSSSISKASFSLSSDIHKMFEDSPLNSDNFFKYAHFSYIQCPNGAWMACVYFTGEKVSTINFIGTFYNVWHGGSVVEALYTAIPIDMNGTPISDANLMGTWQKTGPTQWAFQPNLPEADVFSGATESLGACFCKRTNCDLIVDGNTVHYDVVRYDSTQGSNHYINTSIPAHWWHMPYGCSGDAQLQITSRYFARSNKQEGDNVTWSTQGNPLYPWQGLPTTLPSAFTDDSEKYDVIINNILLGEPVILPDAGIDSRTSGTLMGDMDDYDLSNDGGNHRILIDKDTINDNILNDDDGCFDIIDKLKIRYVNISACLDIKTGSPIEPIAENLSEEYKPYYNTNINYFNNGLLYLSEIPGGDTFALDRDNINKVMQYVWLDNAFASTFDYKNITPIDCIINCYALPFRLDDTDFAETVDDKVYIGNTYFNYGVVGKKLSRGLKILTTNAVLVGGRTKTKNGNKSYLLKKGRGFLDFPPYTQASIYIPFVGEREIDINLIMYRWVYIQYRVSPYTGDFVATVYSMKYSKKANIAEEINQLGYTQKAYPVLTCVGNMALEYPIAGRNVSQNLTSLVNGIGGAVLGGVAGGGIGAVLGGAISIGSQYIGGGSGSVISKGSLNGTPLYLSNWSPYITLYSHEPMRGFKEGSRSLAYNETIGLRTERSIKIGNMGSGIHRIEKGGCKLDGIHCTQSERAEIQRILEEDGIYISYPLPE